MIFEILTDSGDERSAKITIFGKIIAKFEVDKVNLGVCGGFDSFFV